MLSPDEAVEAQRWEDLEWSTLAAHWLAEGYDSEPLRRVAAMDVRASELLPGSVLREVLRSVGVALPAEGTLQRRCDQALATIQADLDRTGFGAARFRALAIDDHSFPLGRSVNAMFRVELIGVGWDHNVDVLDAFGDPENLLRSAAAAVTDALVEMWFVAWPECAIHNGPPLGPTQVAAGTEGVRWYCPKGAHVVAPVGRLDPGSVRPAPPVVSPSGSG